MTEQKVIVRAVQLHVTCKKCGEEIALYIDKHNAKAIFKAFQQNPEKVNLFLEKNLRFTNYGDQHMAKLNREKSGLNRGV